MKGKSLMCPKCKARYSWPKGKVEGLSCTVCLLDRAERIQLVPAAHAKVTA
jgi:hypothetical protein